MVSIVIRLWAAFTRNYDLIPMRGRRIFSVPKCPYRCVPTQHLVHWVMRNLSLG